MFEILDCFADDQPEQTIAGLCTQTGLPPATVHRLLAHLVEWGAVERASRGRYRLGRRLWRLGWGVPQVRQLRDAARPFLVDLYSATATPVALWSREHDETILSDLIAGHSVAGDWHPKRRVPLLQTAAGMAFLAHSTTEGIGEFIRSGALETMAPSTSEFMLRQQLSEVRRMGFAASRPQQPGGTAWLAAPIFDSEGNVRAAVSVAVPGERLSSGALIRLVIEAARGISAELGHRGGRSNARRVRYQPA
ncbi:IclR family transcriptional regulator [Streptomyces sp. NPDC002577]